MSHYRNKQIQVTENVWICEILVPTYISVMQNLKDFLTSASTVHRNVL